MAGDSVQCLNAEVSFGEVLALPRTSFSLGHRESLAIMGPSGSGKSTLLACIQGMQKPTSGIVQVLGQDQGQASRRDRSDLRRQRMGLIQQNPHLLPEFSALENVAFPLLFSGMNRSRALNLAQEALDDVGMMHRAVADVRSLSGGEAQRIAVARALIHPNVSLIVADEPTASLDVENAYLITDLLLSTARKHDASVVLATHDPAVARQCDRSFRLSREHATS